MSKTALTVPAAEANRSFSKLLRAAREGTRITITSHGEPVAELGPVSGQAAEAAERRRIDEAHDRLVRHLRSVKPRVVGPWTREELYDLD
jgi:prevent-host-death family protein